MVRYDTEDAIKRVLRKHLGAVDRDLIRDLTVVCEWSEKTALHEAMPESFACTDFPLVMLGKLGLFSKSPVG